MFAAIPFPELSPELFSFSIFGREFALRWYALAYIIGILIGWRLAVIAVKNTQLWLNKTPPMTPFQIENMMTWIILGVLVGGRLGYVIFYDPVRFINDPLAILQVWKGGMAFHGGLLGVILAAFIYTRVHKINQLSAADLCALGAPIGLMLGRISNFINGELWGRATDLPWAVIFPGAAAQNCPDILGPCARHPSQLYEAFGEGFILFALIVWLIWRRDALKRPGLVCGVFLMGYGLVRFFVEFVRQPDAQFQSPGNPLGLALHIEGFGLTMGQILTTPMILIGVILLWNAIRKSKRNGDERVA